MIIAKKLNDFSQTHSAQSVNTLSAPMVRALIQDADALGIKVSNHHLGCTIVDAGIECIGSLEAGRRITGICMGGLGEVAFTQDVGVGEWHQSIAVKSDAPVLACLASQYAGWALKSDDKAHKFFALGSGPARALAIREDLFKELAYHDEAEHTCIVLEADAVPPDNVIEKIVRDTRVSSENLTVILTPTTSIAGNTQVVGRVLEVALHKAHTLHFPLVDIMSGWGVAVLPPVAKDFMMGMGRTNDAILFGGTVYLNVRGKDDAIEAFTKALPSSASKDYGKPFADVFKSYNMDFYQIDPMLFSPAKVVVTNIDTQQVFEAGFLNPELINISFKDT
jgi:methenyltetrahydromethanopterin cyclohydrolase